MISSFYSSRQDVVALVSHSIAILCTIFRLAYRGWMRNLWWEDAWAAFALIEDAVCLACIWHDSLRITSWILVVTFISVPWAARMSIIFSIIRITNHTSSKIHRQIIYAIAVSFAFMWVALLTHRITRCALHSCFMGKSAVLSRLITDVIADIFLVAAPLYLWSNVGLLRSTKILVLSAFSASLLNIAITVPHSIVLLEGHKIGGIVIIVPHIKAALSLVVCDLLVIATAVYHICWKENFDLDQSCGVFTSVVFAQMPCATNSGTSHALEEGTETEATKAKMEDARVVYVEEGAGTEY
ncbi:hypothetical protein BD769DRAFT_416289 [Suillus cothurnatus]|nr:hypothetical protein BD769DRAFT_416289 [Suillus cothurnatus]